jgi:hypothetical protein
VYHLITWLFFLKKNAARRAERSGNLVSVPLLLLLLLFASEMSQQLPANLVGIMEQRMKLIEQRSAYLQEQINQVISDGQASF